MFPSLKLTYFDLGGRAEAARIVLHMGGVPFQDERLTPALFQECKSALPYGKIPVLYVDGEPLAESLAILRFAARLADMYPVNDATASMLVDEVLDTLDEFSQRQFMASFMENDAEKKKAMREQLLAGPLPKMLQLIDTRLAQIATYPLFQLDATKIYVHEVLVWDYVVMFQSGFLDHIPVALIEEYKTIMAIHDKVAKHPKVRHWLAKSKTPKNKLKLTYFDMPGRAEQIRLAFHIGGVAFEDDRVQFADFPARKLDFPYQQMPVLYVDDQVAAQTFALLRYAGTLSGLYPENDPMLGMKIDELLGHSNELSVALEPALLEQDPEKKRELQETLARETIPESLGGMEKRLAHWKKTSGSEDDSPFAVGGALSIVDLSIFSTVQFFKSGFMSHVPATIMDEEYPLLLAASEAVARHPRVKDWYATHPPAKAPQ